MTSNYFRQHIALIQFHFFFKLSNQTSRYKSKCIIEFVLKNEIGIDLVSELASAKISRTELINIPLKLVPYGPLDRSELFID